MMRLIIVYVLTVTFFGVSSEIYICKEHIYYPYYGRYEYTVNLIYSCSEETPHMKFTNLVFTPEIHCSNLDRNINITENKVNHISFKDCQLTQPDFNFVNIYTNVTELDVSHTGLERLQKKSFEAAGTLIKFNASHNNITEIPALLFLSAEHLQLVDLSNNRIKKLDNFSLSGTKHLRSLDLSYNYLENIETNSFENFLHLENLYLAHNKINQIASSSFAILESLKSLDLSFNNIQTLNKNMFEGLVNLNSLSLQKLCNETLNIEPSTFVELNNLILLHLESNRITNIEQGIFNGLDKLTAIYLSPVEIDRIEKFGFAGLDLIRELDLSNDPLNNETILIDKEAFENLTSLRRLNLANNPVNILNVGIFSKLEHLQYLNLSNMNLREIKLGTFSHTLDLRVLDLSRNYLQSFDFSLFLPRNLVLNSLYLNENRLLELEEFTPTIVPSLTYIGLTGNSFNCSYLKEFLRKIPLTVVLLNNTVSISNRHETNIHGIKCQEIDTPIKIASTIIALKSTTDTTTIKTKTSETVIFPRENSIYPNNTKNVTNNLIDFSVSLQEHSELRNIKLLLVFVSVMLSILIIALLVINRQKMCNIQRYAGFLERSDPQSTVSINNDYEISVFNPNSADS